MTFNQFIISSIVSSLLFLAVLLQNKQTTNTTGYWMMSVVFMTLALVFADELIAQSGFYRLYPLLKVLVQPIQFLFSPFIYLTVVWLTSLHPSLSIKSFWHFLLYCLVVLIYLAFFFKIGLDGNESVVVSALTALLCGQVAIYLFFSIQQLRAFRKTLPLFVSTSENYDLDWLFKTLIGVSVISALAFVQVVFESSELFFNLMYLFGVFYTGFYAVQQKDIFPYTQEQKDGLAVLIAEQTPKETPDETLRKRVLTDEKLALFKSRLLALMDTEKPYLDSELTLPKLAKSLGLNTYQTSYLINHCFDENFYHFINRYRLEMCKRLLLDKSLHHKSIIELAYQSGFNSKTVFNTFFKKSTGNTPKEFREKAF